MVSISKISFIGIASVGLALGVGCSKSEKSHRDKQPRFTVPDSAHEKLQSAECTAKIPELKCDERAVPVGFDQKEVSRLTSLRQALSKIKTMKASIDEARDLIKGALKKGGYESVSAAEGEVLLAKLESRSAILAVMMTSLDVEILNEENYQQVLGFACVGTYLRTHPENNQDAKQEIKIEKLLLKGAKAQKGIVQDSAASYFSRVELGADGLVTYVLTDHAEVAEQRLRQAVATDGEFLARSQTANKASMNCARSRVYGSAVPFSDRARSSVYYTCQVHSTFNGKLTRVSFGFPAAVDSESKIDLVAVEALDDQMNTRPEARHMFQKYLAQVSVNKGRLDFAIQDLVGKTTAMETAVMNSAEKIRMDIDDNQGNSLIVDCANTKK